ncbi:MAG: N-acetylglucosamine-6-phosphate deacetylase [Flavobacteriales bacterium]|nr:N-acetylglucosamine-6-phosphate deacetylase [Flavobacteriales bacterium]
MKLIKNIRVVSPDVDYKCANIVIDGENIKSVIEKEVNPENFDEIIDGEDLIAVPGFIDQHAHGAVGRDTCDGTAESIDMIAQARLKEGVTMWLPTTLTVPYPVIEKAVNAVAEYRKNPRWLEVPGMHIEGPFINVAMKGAQNPDYIKFPDASEIKKLNDIVPVKIITVAPEVEGAIPFIREMKKIGVVTSAGHSSATYADFLAAKKAGLTNLTHFFNQMSPLHHREIGLVGAGFADNDVNIELICDKLHVKADIIKIVFNTKSVDQIILITDALLASGLPDGEYEMGGLKMILKNREARLESGALMGSTLPYQYGLKNVYEITGLPLDQIIKCTSWNQANSLNIDNVGKIQKGYRANIAILDHDFNVMGTMVRGELRYKKEGVLVD